MTDDTLWGYLYQHPVLVCVVVILFLVGMALVLLDRAIEDYSSRKEKDE